MQGATIQEYLNQFYLIGFNPRPLCRERRREGVIVDSGWVVSIHAPYAGSDRTDGQYHHL